MILFINGVFFQEQQYLHLGRHPEMGEAMFINTGMFMSSFFGVCMVKDGRISDGYMMDHYGYSDIKSVSLEPNQQNPRAFCFQKKYVERDDVIHYTFSRKVGNVWIGTYEGQAVGRGVSKCVLTEVEDDGFFDPRSTLGVPE